MIKPRICAVITRHDHQAVREAELLADLFELRIDLVGSRWPETAAALRKPWMAANRGAANGGKFTGGEEKRTEELLRALELGASYIDIEFEAESLADIVKKVKGRAKCVISHHDWSGTPPQAALVSMVQRQLAAGADVAKLVTTANCVEDNLALLTLPSRFPWAGVIALAMGAAGALSRVLSPLAGGFLTYASIKHGSASAPGQLTAEEMRAIYRTLREN
jgi:3-dehydroquinate dehydratase type I